MKKQILVFLIILFCCNLLADQSIKGSITEKIDKINISSEIKVFLIAMIPIFELRGAIPIGVWQYKLPLWKVFPIAVAGNMVPIFLILLFFDLVTTFCYQIPFLKKILEAVFQRTRQKSAVIRKYEEIGLMLFVAIPLPVTGAWTGSLAAYLFGLKFWKSILFIFLGVLIAGIVVSFLTSLKWVGVLLACLALLYLLVKSITRRKVKNEIPEN